MTRKLSPRSVWHTTKRRPRSERPTRYHRSSPIECSGSATVIESQSAKAVDASSKVTPCFSSFARAFTGSHSNFTRDQFTRDPSLAETRGTRCVPGSPMDSAAMAPTASPISTSLPMAWLRPSCHAADLAGEAPLSGAADLDLLDARFMNGAQPARRRALRSATRACRP